MDCSAIADGFREDIQFRFSLGWDMMAPRLLGARGSQVCYTAFCPRFSFDFAPGAISLCSDGPLSEYGCLLTVIFPSPF